MPTQSERDIKKFNEWAKTYDRSFLQRLFFGPIQTKMLDICNSLAGQPTSVLDIGCGTGRLLAAARGKWPEAKFFGVDPAPQMIFAAQRLNPQADFKISMAESLPLPDQSMDLVLSSLSFHHWKNQEKALVEIARVLRPGGRFCLADHTAIFFNVGGEKAKTKTEIRSLFASAGLTVVEQKKAWTRFVLISVGQK